MNGRKGLSRDDWATIGLLVLFIAILTASAFLVSVLGVIGLALFVLIAVGGIYCLVSWHSAHYAYICNACGEKFSIGFWQDLLSPHTTRAQYLKCPHCGKRTWAHEAARE